MPAPDQVREQNRNATTEVSKVLGSFPASGVIEGVNLGLSEGNRQSPELMLQVVRELPGIVKAEPFLPGRAMGASALLFFVSIDCSKLNELGMRPEVSFVQQPQQRRPGSTS